MKGEIGKEEGSPHRCGLKGLLCCRQIRRHSRDRTHGRKKRRVDNFLKKVKESVLKEGDSEESRVVPVEYTKNYII